MRGLMQDEQLVLTRFLERAAELTPRTEIVTRLQSGTHRETYADLADRVARAASALAALGIRPGDRVGTFAWNSWRHLELYLAVPCMGAVLHTLNIRLHHDQVAWIARHAEDRVVLVDDSLLETFAPVAEALGVPVIAMGDGGAGDPERYDDLLAAADPSFRWPDVHEDDACLMVYTSGTTGDPKGVVYSHRSVVLHSFMTNQASVVGLTDRDTVLPVVPMFHAGAWGLPHAGVLAGAKQVFAGPLSADPATLADLIETERVTVAAGVPTVWIGLLRHLEQHPADLSSLRLIKAGGAAVPPALIRRFEQDLGVEMRQGWGMTETGPLAALSRLGPDLESLPEEERYRMRAKVGQVVPGIRFRVVDPGSGEEVPRDGTSVGEIQVRGPWVAAGYYRDEARTAEAFADGWLRTGDVATVDGYGFIELVDRTKDLVKSGGEWISSVALENALMGHPAVLEACVVAVPDERWTERPVAWIVLRDRAEATVTDEDLRAHLSPSFPRWWLPDRFDLVEDIPKTSVGKFDKVAIRARLSGAGG